MTARPGDVPLYRFEKVGLALGGLLIVAFGVVTEIRSAFLQFRHTDFNCYTHVGWLVRTGGDVYGSVATNGLHYTYPSAFAILMVPFAEPPPWVPNDGQFYVPYSVSVGVWYTFSVACVLWACHVLASAVLPDAKRGTRRWWYARSIPFYVCIGGVGFSLGRGQVNLLLVALVAGMLASAVRNRRIASGAWLGTAIVFKLIPAFLLLFPFMRRDWRAGAGVALASFIGLIVVPFSVFGPQQTLEQHEFFVKNIVLAGTAGSGDHPMGKDLTETTATDSQSFQAALHHIIHWELPREDRPPHASKATRLAHWGISGVLTLITMLVARKRLTNDPVDQSVFLGCLCALLMVVSPVSHMHYYAIVLPLVAALWLRDMSARPGQVGGSPATVAAITAWGIMTALPLFPGPIPERLREIGFGAAATVGLWAYGLAVLGKKPAAAQAVPEPAPLRIAA